MKLRDNHHIVLTTPDIDRFSAFIMMSFPWKRMKKTGKSAYTSVFVKSR